MLLEMKEKELEELVTLIKHCRPHLSAGSVTTYRNVLKNLYEDVFGRDTPFNARLIFADYQRVLDHLATIKFNVRKTILSAVVCIAKDEKPNVVAHFRNQMIEDAQKYNSQEKENKMSETQKKNWIPWEDIVKLHEKLKEKVAWILKSDHTDRENLLELQKYVLQSCYVLIPPRRAKDFTEMKWKDFDPKTDNYYHKGTFHFNDYKTARFYGEQTVKTPKTLELLIARWIKKCPSEYLFADYEGKKLTSAGISKVFYSIFKKNISVNMLRHSYITDTLGPAIADLEEKAEEMGHTVAQQKLYVKKD
jgi:hypothetical protein